MRALTTTPMANDHEFYKWRSLQMLVKMCTNDDVSFGGLSMQLICLKPRIKCVDSTPMLVKTYSLQARCGVFCLL